MADESDAIRIFAIDVGVDPEINGHDNVQAAIGAMSGAKWIVTAVPTADPHVVGQVWANSGVLTVSAG